MRHTRFVILLIVAVALMLLPVPAISQPGVGVKKNPHTHGAGNAAVYDVTDAQYGAIADAVEATDCDPAEDTPMDCDTPGTGTDDSAAFRAAAVAASAATPSGGTVYVPCGLYRIADTVAIDFGNVTFQGEGACSVLLSGTMANPAYMFDVCDNYGDTCTAQVENVHFKDLVFRDDDPFSRGLGDAGRVIINADAVSAAFDYGEVVTFGTSMANGRFYWQDCTGACAGAGDSNKTMIFVDVEGTIADTNTFVGDESTSTGTVDGTPYTSAAEESHSLRLGNCRNCSVTGSRFEFIGDEVIDIVHGSDAILVAHNHFWNVPGVPSASAGVSTGESTNVTITDNFFEGGLATGPTGGSAMVTTAGGTGGPAVGIIVANNHLSEQYSATADHTAIEVGIALSSSFGDVDDVLIQGNTIELDIDVWGTCSVDGSTCDQDSDCGTDDVDITGILQAATAVVSTAGHDFINGDTVRIVDVEGMIEVNNRSFTVAGTTLASGTVAALGACGGPQTGDVREVTDPTDGADCTVGGVPATADHLCECNGAAWVFLAAEPDFELSGINSTGYAAWTAGGTARVVDVTGPNCLNHNRSCDGGYTTCAAVVGVEGAQDILDVEVSGNHIAGRIILRADPTLATISFLDNPNISGDYDYGLYIDGKIVLVSGNAISGHQNGGIFITSSGDVSILTNSFSEQGAGSALAAGATIGFSAIGSADSILIQGNTIIGEVSSADIFGIDCQANVNSTVQGNHIFSTDSDSIRGCQFISGNVIKDPGRRAIWFEASGTSITNNRIFTAATDCIVGIASLDNLVIDDNFLQDCDDGGITVDTSVGSKIIDNYVEGLDALSDGIICENCQYTQVIGNTVFTAEEPEIHVSDDGAAGTSDYNICMGNINLDSAGAGAAIMCGDAGVPAPGDRVGCADEGGSPDGVNTYCGGNVVAP